MKYLMYVGLHTRHCILHNDGLCLEVMMLSCIQSKLTMPRNEEEVFQNSFEVENFTELSNAAEYFGAIKRKRKREGAE